MHRDTRWNLRIIFWFSPICSYTKSWDVTGSSGEDRRGTSRGKSEIQREGARERGRRANIKERARRGRGTSWTTRERGSGLVGNWRRTPYLWGVPYLIRLPRNRRDLSFSRELHGVLLSVGTRSLRKVMHAREAYSSRNTITRFEIFEHRS